MLNEAGIAVEDGVIVLIQLEALRWCQHLDGHRSLILLTASLRSRLLAVAPLISVDPIPAGRTQQVTFPFPEDTHRAFDRLPADQALKQG